MTIKIKYNKKIFKVCGGYVLIRHFTENAPKKDRLELWPMTTIRTTRGSHSP